MPHTVALKIELHAPNGFVCLNKPSGLFTLEEDCSKEISFTVLPPKEKAGFYPAEFIISTYYNGLLWKTDRLSFSLLPSFDWKLRAGEKVSTVYSPDSSIALPYGYGSLELSTYLHVESDCIKRLKACVSCPVALYVDGELAMKNEHTTDVIPAYHRPSEKEWTGSLRKGNHEIKLLLTSAEQVDRLYFYAVTPEQTYYAADILCTQNLEPQAGKAT